MSEEDAWTVAAFMHDVPSDIVKEALKRERGPSPVIYEGEIGVKAWPVSGSTRTKSRTQR
jgi:hypothetical protein